MRHSDVGKPDDQRAGELAYQGVEEARADVLPSDGVTSLSGAGVADDSNNPEGDSAGTSNELARLAKMIAILKSCDPQDVLQRLHDAPAIATVAIANAVTALKSLDALEVLKRTKEIINDPKLATLVLPSRRRPRRPDVVTYQVRIDLKGTKPPVWRRLELASDLFLNEVHGIIQTAFDWADAHLHHFASGSGYSSYAEDYLCPYEVEEGKVGIPQNEVRLDEVLVDIGDKLFYVYDYGDNWEHIIKLEAILPRDDSTPEAVCTAGRRPSPPEDCGGVRGYEKITAATDSTHPKNFFDVDEVNMMLAYYTE